MGGLSVPCTYHLSIIFQELLCRVAAATAAISKDADQLFTCRRNITDQYLWINFSSISHVYKITVKQVGGRCSRLGFYSPAFPQSYDRNAEKK